MLLQTCLAAQASTSNLSVFSEQPVEINGEVSQNLVRLSDLSKDLADKNARIEEFQTQQQNIQEQIVSKQAELGEQLKLVYTTKPLLSSLDILLNSKSYTEIENSIDILDYLAKRTYGRLNENVEDYDKLLQEYDQLVRLQQSQQETADNIKQEMGLLEDKGILPRSQQLNVPDEIKYRDISQNYDQIIEWLNQRGSKEASREYLDIINAAGQVWNVDPLLLLAITGQEQAFVPANDSDAEKIINNPWNVFHSWQEFQAGFSVSSLWAANTVARLSQNCPGSANIIRWINGFSGNEVTTVIDNNQGDGNPGDTVDDNTVVGTSIVRDNPAWGYADDPNWWVGVSQYYDQLKSICE